MIHSIFSRVENNLFLSTLILIYWLSGNQKCWRSTWRWLRWPFSPPLGGSLFPGPGEMKVFINKLNNINIAIFHVGKFDTIAIRQLSNSTFDWKSIREHNREKNYLQRSESDARGRAGNLFFHRRAASPLLLLQIFLQSLGNPDLGLFVDLGRSDSAGAAFADGASTVSEVFLVSVAFDLKLICH